MGLVHLNPETGEPGVCKALQRCPFGSSEDHYSSKEEARRGFELTMTAQEAFEASRMSPSKLSAYKELTESWVSSLSPELKESVKRYVEVDYMEINSSLWKREHHSEVENLDKALSLSSPLSHSVFRKPVVKASSRAEANEWVNSFQPGEVITFPGYTSTSSSIDSLTPLLTAPPRPSSFLPSDPEEREALLEELDSSYKNVVFVMNAKRGVPVGGLGRHVHELEFLLPRDTSWRVVGVTKTFTEDFSVDVLTGNPGPFRALPLRAVLLEEV